MHWTNHTTGLPRHSEMQFSQLINVCRRRWGLIALIAGIGTALVSSILLAVLPRYTATALVIDRSFQGDDTAAGAIQGAYDSFIDTEIAMLTTQQHLQRVSDSLSQPANAENSPDPELNGHERWPTSLKELQSRINVKQERRAPVIAVSFMASTPQKAAAVANRVVQLLIDDQSDKLAANASRNLTRFKEQNPAAAATEIKRQPVESRPEPNLQFLSRAYPPNRPSSPSVTLLILIAMTGFTVSGASLAILLDRLDHGLRSAQQVSDALSVPCVGLVPAIDASDADHPHRFFLAAPTSAYAEAIRSLAAAALQLAAEQPGSKTILVTSSLPEEGKTTLAISLASYAARVGRRVLLLDFNTGRPPALAESAAKPDPDALGLILSGKTGNNAVQHVPDLGFDYVPGAGSRPGIKHTGSVEGDDRSALDFVAAFADNRMARLIERLRENYDLIIIDGPSVLEATEARLLAVFVDRILFAVRWGKTHAEVAYNALQSLQRNASQGHMISANVWAVVTRVDIHQHAKYHFGDALEFYVQRKHGQDQPICVAAAATQQENFPQESC
jgi:polysaccharide biosynthesis transport protein